MSDLFCRILSSILEIDTNKNKAEKRSQRFLAKVYLTPFSNVRYVEGDNFLATQKHTIRPFAHAKVL